MKLMTPHDSEFDKASIRYEIVHATRYCYGGVKRSSVMSLCKRPRNTEYQEVVKYSLVTEPDAQIDEDIDNFGNLRHIFDIHRPHERLAITSSATVLKWSRKQAEESTNATNWSAIHEMNQNWRLWEFTQPSELTKTSVDLPKWIANLGGVEEGDPLTMLRSLEKRLSEVITYSPGKTTIDSTVDDVLVRHEGVCQDISQLMIAISRSWGVPSRYVSGYLYVQSLEEKRIADNATHAWVECLLPNLGWCAFDPTNPHISDDSRIAVGYGRDYRDVPPTRGITLGEGDTTMEVEISVVREDVNT